MFLKDHFAKPIPMTPLEVSVVCPFYTFFSFYVTCALRCAFVQDVALVNFCFIALTLLQYCEWNPRKVW